MEIIQEKSKFELGFNIKNFNVGDSDFHWHNNYELCYLPEKSCNFWIDGELVQANKGDILAIEEHIIHRFMAKSDHTPVQILQFQPKILINTGIAIVPLKKHITSQEIDNVPQLKEKIFSLFDLIKTEKNAPNTMDNLFFQSLSVALYFLLMRNFSYTENISELKKDRLECYKIIGYVNEHFKENINVKEISSTLFISKRRIAILFARYTGIGLNDYINLLRIKNANRMLLSGSSVTEAALSSGFQCIRTFNNVFKDIMRMTPSEYLKKN